MERLQQVYDWVESTVDYPIAIILIAALVMLAIGTILEDERPR